MHPKLSYWLEKSSEILQYRISKSTSDVVPFYKDELNIRRELVSESIELSSKESLKSIVGHYHIIGANSSNTNVGYMGILTLVKFENKIQATWQIEGGDTQTGFGLLLHNVLSLNFNYEVEGKEFSGLVTYEFVNDGIISGIWVEQGADEIGIEMGRKIPVENSNSLQFFGVN